MWVDNLDEAAKKATDAGARISAAPRRTIRTPSTRSNTENPNGIIFDLTHNGWRGAVKEVDAAEARKSPPSNRPWRGPWQQSPGQLRRVFDKKPCALAKFDREICGDPSFERMPFEMASRPLLPRWRANSPATHSQS